MIFIFFGKSSMTLRVDIVNINFVYTVKISMSLALACDISGVCFYCLLIIVNRLLLTVPAFLVKENAGPFTGFIHTFAVLNPGA